MPASTSGPPPRQVTEAFGLDGPPVPLPGGQGGSWRVGGAVLKPSGDASWVSWQSGVLGRLDGRTDLRVSPPLRSLAGSWTVEGWTAWRFEPGEHQPGRWLDLIDVGDRLHARLRDEPAPAFLAARSDPWAVADRVAWGEAALPPGAARVAVVQDLAAARGPVTGRRQVVHGDLTGNVLFHPRLPPLVIDLSPYWRPPGFAAGVVVADALVWHGAGDDLVAALGPGEEAGQLLLRALLFRVVTDLLAAPDRSGDALTRTYRPAAEVALRLCGA